MCPSNNPPAVSVVQQHYNSGWNDTEYGINNWTGHSTIKTPQEWADHVRAIAVKQKATRTTSRDHAYFDGIIDCVDAYKRDGRVGRAG